MIGSRIKCSYAQSNMFNFEVGKIFKKILRSPRSEIYQKPKPQNPA